MPKNYIDYSNTLIYKIICKDSDVKDLYVGHTTNFVQRKHFHKQNCINEKSTNYQCRLYKTIRENGGWNNWSMEIVSFFNCQDNYEARMKEHEYFNLLNATLNSIEPLPKPKEKMPIVSSNKTIEINNKISIIKKYEQYTCDLCDFICYKKSNYETHLLSSKHKNRVKLSNFEKQPCNQFICENCNKTYKARNSLWYHIKKCHSVDDETNNTKNEPTDKELIMILMKENSEMKNLVLEVCQKIQPNNIINNNTTTNSHNKTFNLNVFLNEECKDAMNIMDFVDSLKIQLSDLENVGKLGFVDGISNIIVKNLKAMDTNKRPVHCSDSKREVMYVKDDNKWEKDNKENKKLKKAIKHIAHKNSKMLPEFKAKYPDCIYSDSKKSDQYNILKIEVMGGYGDNDDEKENKIIRKIAKEVIIDK